MSDDSDAYYWANDPYWTEALDRFASDRDSGARTITLDIDAIEQVAFNGDGPAYRLMRAMTSVLEQEGYDGCRGAPRVMLALLQRLKELSDAPSRP